MGNIEIIEANLELTIHAKAVTDLLNAYARDPMGDGNPLSPWVLKNLIPGLLAHPTTIIFLAFNAGKAIGIVTCFKGFSTFMARPIINISDLFTSPGQRGRGIGKRLLAAVEKKAKELNCCKITLEVQENNRNAIAIYSAAGFKRDIHVPTAGYALFFSKQLGNSNT